MASTFETLSFYRGVSSQHDLAKPSILSPRTDRTPRDSPPRFHAIADAWFKQRFKVRYRSQAIFLTSQVGIAAHYGSSHEHVMRVVPLTSYTYCWSPLLADLLSIAVELASAPEKAIHERLSHSQYRQDSLDEAAKSGHEVMLSCDQLLYIPIQLLGQKVDEQSFQIIC